MRTDPALYLYIDCETRSRLDSKKSGLDLYARNCEVLIFCYCLGDGEVRTWLPQRERIPDDLELYLRRPEFRVVAWRAEFERTVMAHALGIIVPASRFVDPAAMARYAALPSNLLGVGKVLKLDLTGEIKDKEGKKLIDTFSKIGKRSYRTPEQEPEKFKQFIAYCKQDVVAERAILKKLHAFMLPEQEQRILALDQKINDTGIPVDMEFVKNGTAITERERARILNEMKAITGLENPNSNKQLLGWLRARGYPFTTLGKHFVTRAIRETQQKRAGEETVMEPKLLYSHLEKRVYIVSRYQDKGNGVIVAQRKHDVTYQFDQAVREIQAYRQFPQGCQCTETDCGGDCEWCREYYGGESIIEAEPATSTADRG